MIWFFLVFSISISALYFSISNDFDNYFIPSKWDESHLDFSWSDYFWWFLIFIMKGSGGNNHALEYYNETKYPLAVKLGTINPDGAGLIIHSLYYLDYLKAFLYKCAFLLR